MSRHKFKLTCIKVYPVQRLIPLENESAPENYCLDFKHSRFPDVFCVKPFQCNLTALVYNLPFMVRVKRPLKSKS